MTEGLEIEELQIHDVRRLEVKEGEVLAVIAPEWCVTAEQSERFLRVLQHAFEPVGVRALVFPHGTELAVVADDQTG